MWTTTEKSRADRGDKQIQKEVFVERGGGEGAEREVQKERVEKREIHRNTVKDRE